MFAWPETWSRMIRTRAGGVCELCGAGRLYGYRADDHTVAYWQIPRPEQTILRISYVPGGIAHHILPVRFFPFFAEHPANGIALCDHCHGKVHGGKGWYGWAAIDCIHWTHSQYDGQLSALFLGTVANTLSDNSYYDFIHLFGHQKSRGNP